jgi:hypothetical protein
MLIGAAVRACAANLYLRISTLRNRIRAHRSQYGSLGIGRG